MTSKRWCGAARGVLIGALVMTAALAATARADTLADVVDRIRPSIIGVGTMELTRRPPGRFGGTGFVIADGHHALTNAHNLPPSVDTERREYFAILVPHAGAEPEVRRADVVGVDKVHDLALLAFEGAPLPAMVLGDSESVRAGERCAFTGFPIGIVLGMRPVTHHGIVSAIPPMDVPQLPPPGVAARAIPRLRHPYHVFELDATAYPGNSGSPLYRAESGVVIGVVNKVLGRRTREKLLEDPTGITFAIPIEYARSLLKGAGLSP